MEGAIEKARTLTLAMNAALAVAVLALVAGVVLDMGVVVLGTLGVFVVAVLAYVVGHVTLHKQVAGEDRATRAQSNDGTVLAALSLIRLNLVLYGLYVVVAAAVAVFFGYLAI